MFSRTFATNHLGADYIYILLKIMERLGWQPELQEDGQIVINIPIDDFEMWENISNHMIDI